MEINKLLKKIYYDAKHPAGYSGLDKLYKHAKQKNKKNNSWGGEKNG